jgi:hypothetical protein
VAVQGQAGVRGYALASPRKAAVYLHHFSDHQTPVNGLRVSLDVPAPAVGYWYDPATAAILASFDAPQGRLTVEAPPFTVDLALLVAPDGPPDVDGDGIGNHHDDDDDNDGVPDAQDAFPLDPSEWADADRDLIGDNLDADDDGDGVADDKDGDGVPDHEQLDFDGDGVPRAHTAPWDAFPDNPAEWRDTDGDGRGDNADLDDDGDGWTDEEETQAGSNPLDAASVPG